jgi:hypothetical protein
MNQELALELLGAMRASRSKWRTTASEALDTPGRRQPDFDACADGLPDAGDGRLRRYARDP